MKPRTIEEWMKDTERDAGPQRRRRLALIPEVYWDKTWDDLEDDCLGTTPDDTKPYSIKRMLRAYADDWEEALADADGLVLVGAPGYGKTFGAALVAMDVIDQGGWVRFITFAELVARESKLYELRSNAERNDDWEPYDKEDRKLRWIKYECDLLVLDDVGKERRSGSDLRSDILDLVLRGRVNSGKSTIITTNLEDSAEWALYNASMESFLFQLGEVIEYVKGTDHRAHVERSSRAARRARR